MKDNKEYKIISIIALILGAVGVTLGYAAFSSTLTIASSAQVNPAATNFNVDFSSSASAVVTDEITPSLNKTATGFSATNATIDNSSDPVISNLVATFTEPGQSVTYSFYAYNAGEYTAYLNGINFSGTKTCTAKAGTTQALATNACSGINLSVKVGNDDATTTSVGTISGHSLTKNASEPIVVTIEYATGSAIADGNFDVTLPDIVLNYDSLD